MIKLSMKVNLSAKKQGVRTDESLHPEDEDEIKHAVLTGRVLMSQIHGIFDPLGLLSPITVKFKLVLQNLVQANTLISGKPTLNYAELCTLMARAASVFNDRRIGVKSLTEDEIVPLTVNQLLLGRTFSDKPVKVKIKHEGYVTADQYLKELMAMWWKLWRQRALPSLLPYYRCEEALRHKNLQQGDICLMLYETKVMANYRLCKVTEE